MIRVEADVSPEWDSSLAAAELADEAVRAALGATPHARLIESRLGVEISVKFTSDEEVRALNGAYRAKDRATNVLSFPMFEVASLGSLADAEGGEVLLGDLALAYGVCAREAEEKGIAMRDHAAHLVVHGTLHLLGYDHELGEEEADAMERIERAALATLGIADPYGAEARAE